MARTDRATQLQQAFGVVVRERRQELGISQEELARRAGLDRSYVSQIERGLKAASLRSIAALSVGLRQPAHRLILAAEKKVGN